MVKHRVGVKNKAANALSGMVSLLSVMSVKVTGFERLKDDYESCPNFGELYTSLSNAPRPILDDYTLQDGYLFKANKLSSVFSERFPSLGDTCGRPCRSFWLRQDN